MNTCTTPCEQDRNVLDVVHVFACQSFDPDIFTHRALQKKNERANQRTKQLVRICKKSRKVYDKTDKYTENRAGEREREKNRTLILVGFTLHRRMRSSIVMRAHFTVGSCSFFACPRDVFHRFSSLFERRHKLN